jgi:hypothetical protein
MGTSMFGLDID